MNHYVHRYYERRKEGFLPLDSFAIVASSIAVSGTIEDLKILDKAFGEDLTKHLEGVFNERTTSAISIAE